MFEFLQSTLGAAAEIYEPDDAWGVAGLLVIGAPSTIAALLSGWALIRQRRTDSKVDRVQADVTETNKSVNGRPTTAREDIDELHGMIKDVSARQIDQGRDIRGIRVDIGELRGDQREDRQNLAHLETRIARFVRREHPGAEPL